ESSRPPRGRRVGHVNFEGDGSDVEGEWIRRDPAMFSAGGGSIHQRPSLAMYSRRALAACLFVPGPGPIVHLERMHRVPLRIGSAADQDCAEIVCRIPFTRRKGT